MKKQEGRGVIEINEIQEKQNVLWILKQTLAAIKKEDLVKLKELSNRTIHTASTLQDADSITVAVLVYSLSKIIERKRYTSYKEWPNLYRSYVAGIKKAINSLQADKIEEFRKNLKEIQSLSNKLSGKFKDHIREVFRKAEINKASRVYEHGISMEQTAKLLGITIWELAEYAGETGISDVNLTVTMDIKKRLKQAREIFEE